MGFLDSEDNDEEQEEIIVESKQTDLEGDTVDGDQDEVALPTSGSNNFVKPVDNPQEVIEMYETFDKIKMELLDEDQDLTNISGSIHVNKSGWRKIATMFNLSIETFEDERILEEREEGHDILSWRVKARVTAPNGKVSVGSGMAASNESNYMVALENWPENLDQNDPNVLRVDGKWRVLQDPSSIKEHNIYAVAETRAKNRAISDMVGGGEVSAEEMDAEFFYE